MKFKEIIENRYTTKSYDTNRKITKLQIEELKEILHLSPSSINSQPWQFIFVTDKKTKIALAEASYFNAPKILAASQVVVFSAIDNVQFFEEKVHQYLPEGAIGYYNNFVKPKGVQEIKAWIKHQTYLSLGIFLSACASMQIDSTPMEGIETDKYASILDLTNYKPVFAVAIGYRAMEDKNQPKFKPKSRLPIKDVVFEK